MNMYTDTLLLQQLRRGDQAARDFLYEKYAGALHGLITQVVPGHDHTEELLRETFSTIFQTVDSYDPSNGRLFTWMLQIARQKSIQKLRGLNFRRYFDPHVTLTDTPGLGKLMNNLKQEEQQLIQLSFFKGYSEQDVAEHLKIPANTVRTKTRTALAQLNSLL